MIVRSAEHGQPFLRAAKRRLAATQLGFSEQQLLPARDALGLETLFAREVLLCDRDQLLALALLGAQLSDVRALEHREHRVATDARAEVGAHRQHARFGTRATWLTRLASYVMAPVTWRPLVVIESTTATRMPPSRMDVVSSTTTSDSAVESAASGAALSAVASPPPHARETTPTTRAKSSTTGRGRWRLRRWVTGCS